MSTPVGWAGLAVSLLLVAVAAGISWWQHLGLHRPGLLPQGQARACEPVGGWGWWDAGLDKREQVRRPVPYIEFNQC